MHNQTDVVCHDGADVVKKFLAAINNGDAVTFWELMNKEGQGYFKGIWFYALGGMDMSTVTLLADDERFLQDALGQIMGDLKTSLAPLLTNPQIGALQYASAQEAVVPVTAAEQKGETSFTDYIPLVLELAPLSGGAGENRASNGNTAMTCWKVDTLKCFSFAKSEPTQ